MKFSQTTSNRTLWTIIARSLVAALILAFCQIGRADLKLPALKSGTVVYSNVTVYSQTETEVFISHAQGLGNVKISTLDDESLIALGLKSATPEATPEEKATEMMNQVKAKFDSLGITIPVAAREPGKALALPPEIPREILYGVLAAAVLIYLFTCYCFRLICLNAGTEPGFLIWLPILQAFPLLRAAKMSGWFFLLLLIPIVNIGMQIWWSLRIAEACGKSVLVGICLFLPVLNIFAFLYLAFSKGNREDANQDNAGPVKLDGLANA